MMTVKEELLSIADCLSIDATWDDVFYEIEVRRKIRAGLRAVEQGKTFPHDHVKRMFTS